jgi:hypothetical protein
MKLNLHASNTKAFMAHTARKPNVQEFSSITRGNKPGTFNYHSDGEYLLVTILKLLFGFGKKGGN